MCTVKVPIWFGDNRSFKSNILCSSDGPFRTLIETWLGSGVLIIAHNLSLIRNLKQSEYCLYKCSIDCCGKFTKTLLTNKDINTPVLSFWWALNHVVYTWCLVDLTMWQISFCLQGRFFVLFTKKIIFSVESGAQRAQNYNLL